MRYFRPYLKPDDGSGGDDLDIDALLGTGGDSGGGEDENLGGMDIDALLMALGGDESDTAGLSGTASEPGGESSGTANALGEDSDEQLKRLLEMDAGQESSFSVQDNSIAKDVSVYDPMKDLGEEDEEEAWSDFLFNPDDTGDTPVREGSAIARMNASRVRKLTLKQRLLAMSMKKFAAASAVILLIILGTGTGVVFGLSHTYGQRLEYLHATAHLIRLELPVGAANNSTFVTVGRRYGGLFLARAYFGLRGSTFQFDERFDPDEYTVLLYDQDGYIFPRRRQDIGETERRHSTVLQFAPIRPSTEELTLVIQRPEEDAVFEFRFAAAPVFSQPVFVYDQQLVQGGENFFVDSAVFSNTASEINFVRQIEPEHEAVRLGQPSGEAMRILLRETGAPQRPNLSYPAEYYFEEHNLVLGRITFAPLRNLTGRIRVDFENIFINQQLAIPHIDPEPLFGNAPEYEQHIEFGEHTIVLERMGIMGNLVILVLHGHNTETGQRLQTELGVYLLAETDAGIVRVPGQNHSFHHGTDIVFNVEDNMEIVRLPPSAFRLEIDSVYMDLPETSLGIILEEHYAVTHPDRRDAIRAVESAFLSRLAYKSQEISFGDISGFAPEVTDDFALMRHYTPIGAPEAEPMFGAAVIAATLAPNGDLLAIVEEEWALYHNGIYEVRSHAHQAVARQFGEHWVVVRNWLV